MAQIMKLLLLVALLTSPLFGIACEQFDAASLERKKDAWTHDLRARSKPVKVRWLIGDGLPQRDIGKEAQTQMECLLRALRAHLTQAGINARGLKVYSGYRSAARQAAIWTRKFNFTGGPFGRISPTARTLCAGLLNAAHRSWRPSNKQHKTCWRRLSKERRQQEILRTSSAPGISRHHWGGEFDIIDAHLDGTLWRRGERYYAHYAWLQKNAARYGFVQPYSAVAQRPGGGYDEERWHWSYYPLAQALLTFAKTSQQGVEVALLKKWREKDKYDYIRQHWRDYVFNVNEQPEF